MSNAGHPEIRKLQRKFKTGYRLKGQPNAKFFVVGPDGNVVRDDRGKPLSLPNSPSCRRTIIVAEKNLRALGVIA